MNMQSIDRRQFIKTTAATGLAFSSGISPLFSHDLNAKELKVGMIGLDTSHCTAFTKLLNDPEAPEELANCKVVAAYPKGSRDIESSISRVSRYTEEVKKLGVEIVESIEELLDKVDVVLLETNDGKPHLEQAIPVLKAGKSLFIDKPIAGSLSDAIAIFNASEAYNTPVFSSSSLRYLSNAQRIRNGEIGDVLGADVYSPASMEKSHPDLFWYGIHGVEMLYTVMGTGCRKVSRFHTSDTDMVVGNWFDDRIGTFRGIRSGKSGYGGTVFGEKAVSPIGPYESYRGLVVEIVRFFRTGISPVRDDETLEIYTFMEAADESKRRDGDTVYLKEVLEIASKRAG
jgi:hypothetical protein